MESLHDLLMNIMMKWLIVFVGQKIAPELKTVVVNTDVYHNGGANDIQEVSICHE